MTLLSDDCQGCFHNGLGRPREQYPGSHPLIDSGRNYCSRVMLCVVHHRGTSARLQLNAKTCCFLSSWYNPRVRQIVFAASLVRSAALGIGGAQPAVAARSGRGAKSGRGISDVFSSFCWIAQAKR